MTSARPYHNSDLDTLPRMPVWVSYTRAETAEDIAFLSGAVLNYLHVVLSRGGVPEALLRDRLALRAAEAFVVFSGRSERAGNCVKRCIFCAPVICRDRPVKPTWLSTAPWNGRYRSRLSLVTCQRLRRVRSPAWLDAGKGAPVTRVAMVLEAVLTEVPRAEVAALILADAALTKARGREHLLPLLATGLKCTDLRKQGDELRMACHRALISSAVEAGRMAADLARRAAHLNAVAPKLRAKASGEAVETFLTRDAVAPSALPLPDRASRRLCDQLVELGAVRLNPAATPSGSTGCRHEHELRKWEPVLRFGHATRKEIEGSPRS